MSIHSEDLNDESIASEYSSSENEEQIYSTPPETDVRPKRSKEQSVDNPSKKIKLDTNSSQNENLKLNSDAEHKILPKIVEFSPATDVPEECIVLD